MPPESVIVWNTREPLGGLSPEVFEAEVARLVRDRVESAWFFGSFGSASFDRDSDVDLILVMESDKPFLDRALDFEELLKLVPDMDLLVYTPAEFAKLTQDPSPGFWKSVVDTMRPLRF